MVFVAVSSPPESLEAIRVAENYLMKRRFRVRLIELSQRPSRGDMAHDFGIRASCGEMVCVLGSGDWLERDFFAFLGCGSLRNDTVYYPRTAFPSLEVANGEDAGFEPASSRKKGSNRASWFGP